MIDRSKERIKRTGEVFTPPELVNEILDKLPLEVFTDPTKTFVDPACGDGNFLVQVVKRKIANGSTSIEALSTTYGVDIMPDNVELCQAWLLSEVGFSEEHLTIVTKNIICADSLNDWPFEDNIVDELFSD